MSTELWGQGYLPRTSLEKICSVNLLEHIQDERQYEVFILGGFLRKVRNGRSEITTFYHNGEHQFNLVPVKVT